MWVVGVSVGLNLAWDGGGAVPSPPPPSEVRLGRGAAESLVMSQIENGTGGGAVNYLFF